MRASLLAIGITLWLLAGPTTFAQIGSTHYSIEYLTISSDVIVAATITNIKTVELKTDSPDTEATTLRTTLKLQVLRTLKGKAPVQLELMIDDPRGSVGMLASEWAKSKQKTLWFLVETPRAKSELAYTLHLWNNRIDVAAVALGAKTNPNVPRPLLTADEKVLETEEMLLDAVKAEVARSGADRNKRSIRIPIRYDLAKGTGQAGDANVLVVPAVDSPIRIEIAADKKEYPFRGAIRLTVTYTNMSRETVELHGNGTYGPETGIDRETFEVTSGAGRTRYTIHAIEPVAWSKTLEPGQSWKRELDLTAVLSAANDGKERTALDPLPDPFGRLDEYKLRLMWRSSITINTKPVHCGPLESNMVLFRVRW